MRRFAHALVIALLRPFALRPSHLPLDLDLAPNVEHVAWPTYPANRTRGALRSFSESSPLSLAPNLFSDTAVWHASPVIPLAEAGDGRWRPGLDTGLVLLGETAKLVPISVHRFAAISPSSRSAEVTLSLRGDPGETVEIEFATRGHGSEAGGLHVHADWVLHSVTCAIGSAGTAELVLATARAHM